MKNLLKFKVVFLVFSLVSLVSCTSSEDTISSEKIIPQQIVLNDNLQAREGDTMILYRKVIFNKDNKNFLLEEMIRDFTIYLYMDLNFDSLRQVVSFEVEQNNNSYELSLNYEIINLDELDPLALMFVGSFDNVNTTNSTGGEKINIDCNGGTNNGKNIVVDRPTGVLSATRVARQIEKFMSDCLDGGGCLEICKANASISQ